MYFRFIALSALRDRRPDAVPLFVMEKLNNNYNNGVECFQEVTIKQRVELAIPVK